MKHSTKVLPVAAAVTVLSTIACCLPLGAFGIATLSIAVALLGQSMPVAVLFDGPVVDVKEKIIEALTLKE